MKRHWKKLVGAVVLLTVLVVGGSFIYAKVFNKADPAFGQSDVNSKLDSATTTVGINPTSATTATSTATTTGAAAGVAAPLPIAPSTTSAAAAPPTGADGLWTIKEGSEVGYRVKESINGFDTTANGRTQSITGSMLAAGTTITEGQFTVDMTTFKSDESKRDRQFNGRVMDVTHFPESKFVLTAPIDFAAVPPDGGTVTATATGDLTLHGTTNSVTFPVQGTFKNGLVGVLGQIPIVFADYGIPNPTFATVTTEDHGLLEFVLILERT
jgi:polyisoprenoid-binding protein YceI